MQSHLFWCLMGNPPKIGGMNTKNLFFVALAVAASSCATAQKPGPVDPPVSEVVKVTAYTHTESDHVKWGNKTAIGTTLKPGIAASDWSKFPLGTVFEYDGKRYVVEDYGSALVKSSDKVIDIYKPSKYAMRKHPTDHYTIKVVKWGCFEKSLGILKSRLHRSHCRVMYNRILEKLQSIKS